MILIVFHCRKHYIFPSKKKEKLVYKLYPCICRMAWAVGLMNLILKAQVLEQAGGTCPSIFAQWLINFWYYQYWNTWNTYYSSDHRLTCLPNLLTCLTIIHVGILYTYHIQKKYCVWVALIEQLSHEGKTHAPVSWDRNRNTAAVLRISHPLYIHIADAINTSNPNDLCALYDLT